MTDFFKTATNPTVFTGEGTAFRTPEEFFEAGGAQDFSNVQTVDALPFSSAQTLTGEPVNIPSVNVPPTLPAPETQTAQPSLPELFNTFRTEAGLPALRSSQQELLKKILETKTAGEQGIAAEEGRRNALAPAIGARQEQIQKDVATIIRPLVDAYNLTSEQIKTIQSNIEMELGFVAKEREFGFEQQKFQYQVQQDVAKAKQQGVENEIAIAQALVKVPVGQKIEIGGVKYQGLDDTKDIYTVKEEDASGRVTVVGLDKNTGKELYRNDLGILGKGLKADEVLDVSRSEVLGKLQNATNLASAGDLSAYNALPSVLKSYIKTTPITIGGIPLTGIDGKPLIQYTVNEPTEKQYKELAKLLSAPTTPTAQPQAKYTATDVEKAILEAIKAGDSNEQIADDLVAVGQFTDKARALKAVRIYRP